MTALEVLDALEKRGIAWRVTSIVVGDTRLDLVPFQPPAPREDTPAEKRSPDDIEREERELLNGLYGAARGFVPSIDG